MKKLYLMRHATSNWPDSVATDLERPLTKKGEKEALYMAKLLQAKNVSLDLMLVSAAQRTQSTAQFLQEQIKIKETIITEDIYETTHEHLLKVIQDCPDDIQSLLLLAHNPSISMLTTIFLGTYADLPPAVLVEITFDTNSWKSINRETIVGDKIEVPSLF